MTPSVSRHATAASWLAVVRPGLERQEAVNSLVLGIAAAGVQSPYLGLVHGGDGGSLAALLLAPGRLLLAATGTPADAGIAALCEDLLPAGLPVGSVHGTESLAERFAAEWARQGRGSWSVEMRQRLHALHAVSRVPPVPGVMRRARPDEAALCAEWIEAFERDALGSADAASARTQAERRIAGEELYLWVDGEPRALAGRARRTQGTETVNHVYTPPSGRGRGYATALVADLSQRLLDEGVRQCVLFTDLANPTSNRIYARIGYEPVADFSLIRTE